MKRKRILFLVITIIAVSVLAVFVFGYVISSRGYSLSYGRLYFTDSAVYLINKDNEAMMVYDDSEDAELFKGYINGDRVVLLHGGIEDSYPSQTCGYYAFRYAMGDGKYQPDDEVIGKADTSEVYCGNTWTTVYFENGMSHSFMYGKSITVTNILRGLDYDENKVCESLPEYTVDTEFDVGYGINLTEGYARCDKGQAELSEDQISTLKEIIIWAEKSAEANNYGCPLYSFSFTWGTYGISSYDSETGVLIKSKDATHPEKYTTELKLTGEQYARIWQLIKELDIESYRDRYDPHNGKLHSEPSMTLVLTVRTDSFEKSVTAEDIAMGFEADNEKGRRFLKVCREIRDILTETEEWKALPEYEFFYS